MAVMRPVEELFDREFPDFQPFPFGRDFLIRRTIPEILFAGALQPEFGELFRNMTDDEIDDMMRSFRLENCTLRQPLVDLLQGACTRER
jgi:endoglucanase